MTTLLDHIQADIRRLREDLEALHQKQQQDVEALLQAFEEAKQPCPRCGR